MEYVVTGAFVAFFLWSAYRVLHLRLHGLRATGIITGIVEDKASEGPVFSLVVRFTTTTGETIEATSNFGAEGVDSYYRVGEQVTIVYSAKNPQVFIIEGYDVAGLFFPFLLAAMAGGIVYLEFFRH